MLTSDSKQQKAAPVDFADADTQPLTSELIEPTPTPSFMRPKRASAGYGICVVLAWTFSSVAAFAAAVVGIGYALRWLNTL